MNRVRKGDLVEIISGDDSGARGEVLSVVLSKGRLVVRGVNMVKKHQRRTGGVRTQTGIIEFEAPLHASNVMPVCSACDKPVRIGFSVNGEGRKVRQCRACGAIFD